jgi:hypothetical protein
MAKFLILFIGGNIPEDKREQSITDRLIWMNDLRAKNKFIDGSPLSPTGKVIADQDEADFRHDGNSVNGYVLIEAETIDEVLGYVKLSPQVKPEYGSARAEIRPLMPLR